MDDARFKQLADRSNQIYGHRHVLPVGVWVLESDAGSVSQPSVTLGLKGQSPPNKILRALTRLEEIGALSQLPYPGRPHAREFEKRESAVWDLIKEYAAEIDSRIEQPDPGQ